MGGAGEDDRVGVNRNVGRVKVGGQPAVRIGPLAALQVAADEHFAAAERARSVDRGSDQVDRVAQHVNGSAARARYVNCARKLNLSVAGCIGAGIDVGPSRIDDDLAAGAVGILGGDQTRVEDFAARSDEIHFAVDVHCA